MLPVGARGLDSLELSGERVKGKEVGGVPLSLVTPSFRPDYLAPPFSSHLARFKCKIPRSISHKAKQARFKCNIPLYLSHIKPKQAASNTNIPRSKIGG